MKPLEDSAEYGVMLLNSVAPCDSNNPVLCTSHKGPGDVLSSDLIHQSVWLVQRSLFVWVHVDVTLNALLPCVGPAVSTHPSALAQWTLKFSKTPLLPLIWSQSLAFWSRLKWNTNQDMKRSASGFLPRVLDVSWLDISP